MCLSFDTSPLLQIKNGQIINALTKWLISRLSRCITRVCLI